MSRIGILFLMISSCITFNLYAQEDINYQHKSLNKVLEKAKLSGVAVLQEIAIPDSILQQYRIKGKYFLIPESNLEQYKYLYVGRVNSCRAGGCSIENKHEDDSNSEYFDYFILYNAQKKVNYLKVFNYQATHGQEITARGWLKQFLGHDSSESLVVSKNIDAISGATISVEAITHDVEMKTFLLNKHISE